MEMAYPPAAKRKVQGKRRGMDGRIYQRKPFYRRFLKKDMALRPEKFKFLLLRENFGESALANRSHHVKLGEKICLSFKTPANQKDSPGRSWSI